MFSEKNLPSILNCISGKDCWNYYKGIEDFNKIANHFATIFVTDFDQKKFEMAKILAKLFETFPKVTIQDEQWVQPVFKGLNDILLAKISEAQRNLGI